MTKIVYPASSPYYSTPQTSWYTGPIDYRDIPADSSDLFIETLDRRFEHRPDLLSYELYQTPAYWWVFMVRNIDLIRDPIWDMVAGMSMYAPSKARIQSLLG
jgi:hypothetical protein